MNQPHPYYHDDPAAFAYFQQELLSPRLQAAMIKHQHQQQRVPQQQVPYQHYQYHQQTHQQRHPRQDILPHQRHEYVQNMDHHHQQQQQQPLTLHEQQQYYLPSVMVPPQSPTLASYYYEGSNGWVNHYYDSSKQYLSPRAQVDRQPHHQQPLDDPRQQQQQQQEAYSPHVVSSMRQQQQQQQQQMMQQQHYMAQQQQSNYQRLHLPPYPQDPIETNSAVLGIPHYPTSQPAFDMNHLHHHQQQSQPILLDPMPSLLGSQSLSTSSTSSAAAAGIHHVLPAHSQATMAVASSRTRATHKLNQLMTSIATNDPSAAVAPSSSSSSAAALSASVSALSPSPHLNSFHGSPLILPPYATAESQYEEWRENILQYAHNMYAQSPQHPLLLTILHALHDAFPTHLPTLLLLACVYYTHQDYAHSLQYNQMILTQDPQYVEAMSNIGTTLRSLGRTDEAEHWWYQAVQFRPGYWDAVENLVGVLCSASSSTAATTANGDTAAQSSTDMDQDHPIDTTTVSSRRRG